MSSSTTTTPSTAKSPFFRPSTKPVYTKTPGGTKQKRRLDPKEQEHKSTIIGCSANLINAIVGSGIVGLPYAMKEAGFCAGIVLVLLCATLTEKSLRLLIETAKHAQTPSYETLAEAAYGRFGFLFVAINMFIMAYGAMLSYLMIVKDTFSAIFGIPEEDHLTRRAILVLVSLVIIVPLSSQRDMADLAKTSRINVTFDLVMVCIVLYLANLPETWKTFDWQDATKIHIKTIFIGLGVLSFAFVCQHSAFIIAGSLATPTKERWATVTHIAVRFAACLALAMGTGGYIGFQEKAEGNILNSLPEDSILADTARGLLGTTMLFVYPCESFVARHVCVVLFFQGQSAHEGDDTSVLNRRDRRIFLTVALYLAAVIPAALFENLGSVLAATGAVGGSCLSYIGPGIVYIGIHGGRFMELSHGIFGLGTGLLASNAKSPEEHQQWTEDEERTNLLYAEQADSAISDSHNVTDSCHVRISKKLIWYLTGMPLWDFLASTGKHCLTIHVTNIALQTPHPIRIGNVRFARAKILNGNTRVVMLKGKKKVSNDEESSEHCGVETKLLRANSLPKSHGTHRMPDGKIVALPLLSSSQTTLIASSKNSGTTEYQSIDQKIGALAKRKMEEDDFALEDDPQRDPPSFIDFLIAIFYIIFGVVAMTAGLLSIFV